MAVEKKNPVFKDTVTRLYKDSTLAAWLVPAIFIVVAIAFYRALPFHIWALWSGYAIMAGLLRLLFVLLFSRSPLADGSEKLWYRRFEIITTAIAVAWGLMAFLPFGFHEKYGILFVTIVLVSVIGGATANLTASRRLHVSYILIITLPLIIRYLREGGVENYVLALTIILFSAFMIFSGSRISDEIKDVINVRNLNRKLMRNLMESVGDYRAINKELEQKVADEQLAKNTLEEVNELQEAIMHGASHALFVFDMSGEFLRANRAAGEMLEYSAEQLLGKPFPMVIVPELLDEFCDRFVEAALDGSHTDQAETRMRKRNRSEIFVSYSLRPLHKNRKTVGVVATVEDITEKKRLEVFQKGRIHIMESLAVGETLESILMAILKIAEESDPEFFTTLLFFNEASGRLHGGMAPRLPPDFITKLSGLGGGADETPCQMAANGKRRIIAEEIDKNLKWDNFKGLAKEHGLKSCWSQPVIGSDGEVLGTIGVYQRSKSAPKLSEIRFIEECAQMARIAIERKGIEKELLLKNRELSLLFHASSLLSSAIELDHILEKVTALIKDMEILPVEKKMKIFFLEEGALKLAYCSQKSGPDDNDPCNVISVGECLCGKAARSGKIVTSKNAKADKSHKKLGKERNHGHIIVPLKGHSGVIGVLCLFTKVDVDFENHIFKLLESLGAQIGMAIENARLYDEVRQLSLMDSLTSLANRRRLDLMVDKLIPRAARKDIMLSVILLDIDYFKQYNDAHGHKAGDEVLVKTARVMEGQVRESDLLVRYGGEEFLILLLDEDLDGAFQVAERVRKSMKRKTGVTISGGVSQFSGKMDFETLVKKADEALYRAKEEGRNRVCRA